MTQPTEKTVEVIRRTTSYRRLFIADLVEKLGVSRRDKVMFVTEDGQEFMVDIHGHLLVVEVTEEKMDARPNFGPGAASRGLPGSHGPAGEHQGSVVMADLHTREEGGKAMTMLDDIRRDHETGAPGPWESGPWGIDADTENPAHNVFCDAWEVTLAKDLDPVDARRIARVPQLEAALLAAEELAKAGDLLSFAAQTTGGTAGPDECLMEAIDRYAQKRSAFRAAMEGTQ